MGVSARERPRENREASSSSPLLAQWDCCLGGGVAGTRLDVEEHLSVSAGRLRRGNTERGAHLRTIRNLIVVHPRELVDVVAVQTTDCQEGHHFGLSVLAIITRASQHETGGSKKKKKREARK